jgi:peptidoglycan/xylan/chitin deacetylase (PgdA/CDA1 family)/GT2 family glycosyltransferase
VPEAPITGRPRPVLSAVVFGYRDEATVLRAVRSLVEQDSDDPFEVIVATSGGDRTASIVRDAFPDVKVAESPTRLLPGGVRNLGAALATGEIIGFLEADCVARPGWVRNRIALHRAGHEAVASALDAKKGDGRVARAALYLIYFVRLPGHRAGPATEYQHFGLSFTRELLDRAGPFDETLRVSEDTALAERVRLLGVEPWFEPSVCIEHDGPARLTELMRDQYVRGQRDSWAELLRLPSGRHRHRLEIAPGAGALVVALRAAYRLTRRIRATAAGTRDGHTGSRRELAGLLVPLALGLAAFQIGWAVDQLRGARPNRFGAQRDQLPAPTGLRRWVTTDGERVVALTFDGLPLPPDRDELLSVVDATGTPAAFFVTGEMVETRPEDVRTVVAAGHIVGASGWSAKPFPSMSGAELRAELERTDEVLRDVTGQPLRHVRPPAGEYDRPVVTVVESLDLVPWLWTTHPEAVGIGSSAQQMVRQTMDRLTPGSVISLPLKDGDDQRSVVAAVPTIIDQARRRGYTFVALTYLPSGSPPEDSAPRSDGAVSRHRSSLSGH